MDCPVPFIKDRTKKGFEFRVLLRSEGNLAESSSALETFQLLLLATKAAEAGLRAPAAV